MCDTTLIDHERRLTRAEMQLAQLEAMLVAVGRQMDEAKTIASREQQRGPA